LANLFELFIFPFPAFRLCLAMVFYRKWNTSAYPSAGIRRRRVSINLRKIARKTAPGSRANMGQYKLITRASSRRGSEELRIR
jgi:hypothetical protein